ncbi:MAG: SMC-Scp complex subunit ScpB [Bacteroidetes bacterium]|nr:MAG: SMC-Scp complex subunit ScpB [Bacteroidota bacterium]
MELSQIIPHIEALIFASEKPLTNLELVELVNNAVGFIEDRATLDQVEAAVEGIREKYASEFYPFEIRQSGGGWQFLTKGAFHKTIAQLNGDKFLKRLSAAAMETLAIVAYKQPVTKGEIESIRGVNCDYVIQKLLEKELVVITGRNENLPGKPLIYATSKSFMDYFGINSPDDLPKIKEVLADQIVEPTLVNADHFELEEGSNLVVGENGELIDHGGEDEAENHVEASTPEEETSIPDPPESQNEEASAEDEEEDENEE